MLAYMDLCCFNRPFDDQTQDRIYLETEAKLIVQKNIREQKLDLCWSYMLDYENSANPDPDTRDLISLWKPLAARYIPGSASVTQLANNYHSLGFGVKDSLHLACAVSGQATYFLTVDRGILRKMVLIPILKIISPIEFLSEEDSHAN